MSTEVTIPLSPAQIMARLESLEQNQLAGAALNAPAITSPNGIRLMGAVNLGQILLNLPRQRQASPYDY